MVDMKAAAKDALLAALSAEWKADEMVGSTVPLMAELTAETRDGELVDTMVGQ
jgi:hypothetical protein